MNTKALSIIVIVVMIVCTQGILADVKGPMVKADSALNLLYTHHVMKLDKSSLPKDTQPFVTDNKIQITIQFDQELTPDGIAFFEKLGLEFFYDLGEVLHVGPYYGVWIPFDVLTELLNRKDVSRVSSAWKPGLYSPLDVSVPEIDADNYWGLLDGSSQHCIGLGTRIADFDTGIDVTHPVFFKDDGGTYNWIDYNSNGVFDSGTDAVDLNGNSIRDANERLRFFDGVGNQFGTLNWNDGVFDTERDWLYNDANSNGSRQFGASGGYSDSDPGFGERLFIVNDTNGNGVLNTGEQLICLGTSKVMYALDAGNVTRTRGTDIISTQADTNGHGTGVAGIIAGQNYNTDRQFIGVAPGADLMAVDRYGNNMSTYLPWARNRNADVMLYEFGGWVFQFLDGSTTEEAMLDTEATSYGSAQVVPAGNLADSPSSGKHATTSVPGSGSISLTTSLTSGYSNANYIYISLLWRDTSNHMSIQIQNPSSTTTTLNGAGSNQYDAQNYQLYSWEGNSSRGTRRFDIQVYRNTNANVDGTWTITLTNSQGSAELFHGYITDDISSWSGGFNWGSYTSNAGTITYPATADQAITLASYATRWDYSTPGTLSSFSGRGARIDGTMIMDVAAPGNWDIWSAGSKDASGMSHGYYNRFSGTSAAGPHVAAAAALLMQYNPAWTHAQVKAEIRNSALQDSNTGAVPNNDWGYGKLRLDYSIGPPTSTPTAVPTATPTTTPTPDCLQPIFFEDFSSGTLGQFTNCTAGTDDWFASNTNDGVECLTGYYAAHNSCTTGLFERMAATITVDHDCAEVSYCFIVTNYNAVPDTVNVYVKCVDGNPCTGGTLAVSHAGTANGVCTYYPGVDSGTYTFNVQDFISLCQSGCSSFYLIFEYECNNACVALIDTVTVRSDIDGSCGCASCFTPEPTPVCQWTTVLNETFEAWPAPGWIVINNGGACDWRLGSGDGVAVDANNTGGTGDYADADSDDCGSATTMDTELRSPPLDFTDMISPMLEFKSDMQWYNTDTWNVDLSFDGGATWPSNLLSRAGMDYRGPETIQLSLPGAEGQANIMVRFHYTGAYDYWWQVDDVVISACSMTTPTPEPTSTPTTTPTDIPTEVPTATPPPSPTAVPTDLPTPEPTDPPTAIATETPTSEPTTIPESIPAAGPLGLGLLALVLSLLMVFANFKRKK